MVVTNPDMLHKGILPHHTKWVKLFENLRYVIVDELHSHRGVYGSHVANIFRRLHRLCRFYGSDPQFLCSSATIGNPKELAEAVTGKEMTLIDESGAPKGEKYFAIYNPPVVNRQLGIRKSALGSARDVALSFLKKGLQTIVFAPSRLATEVLVTYLKESLETRPGTRGRHPRLPGRLPAARRDARSSGGCARARCWASSPRTRSSSGSTSAAWTWRCCSAIRALSPRPGSRRGGREEGRAPPSPCSWPTRRP